MHSPSSAAPRSGTEELPVEFVSDEEMALIDAALAAAAAGARPLLSSAARRAAAPLSCAAYSAAGGDIEDSPLPRRSLLARFRERRALAVTDITATEWCEKQMEFVLEHGKPERTKAMKAGSDRHAQLEQEVVERVDVAIRSVEELWAVKFMNFIMGTNQLMFEGITREIPVIGVVEGSWMIGIIDEIRMPTDGISFQPILVDTKTRVRPTIPSEAQKRNGRLQLMCYKYLWDNLIAEKFPSENFFSYFDLDPNYLLSNDVKQYTSSLGFNAKTLEDVLKYFIATCNTLPRSQELLLLRYELQGDHSLLEEYQFTYDGRWFKDQIQEVLGFWQGSREPKFVTEEERWKCSFCKFASKCPMIASTSRNECNLNQKNVLDDDTCSICSNGSEDEDHIVARYPFATALWTHIGWVQHQLPHVQELWSTSLPAGTPQPEFSTMILLCCWELWKHRHDVVFRSAPGSLASLLRNCKTEALLWKTESRHHTIRPSTTGAPSFICSTHLRAFFLPAPPVNFLKKKKVT